MRGLAGLLAAIGVVAAGACGSTQRADVATNDHRVRIAPYAGRLYSVAQVSRAFTALGLDLHRAAAPGSGLVALVNDARVGPQHLPRPPRAVRVIVAASHTSESTELERGRNTRVMRYANVTVLSKPYVLYEARGALSALRWGSVASLGKPRRGSIVLGNSIDGIQLDEPRPNVERAFGAGHSIRRGLVSYFGGHVIVNYWFHDGLYSRVMYVETRWRGYRARSGVHVGSSRRELRPLYATCAQESCFLQAGPVPDPVGTAFTLRHGSVFDITIGRFG